MYKRQDDLLGGDVAHLKSAKVRQQLSTDDVVLGSPGVLLEPGFHIRRIEVHETPKMCIRDRNTSNFYEFLSALQP